MLGSDRLMKTQQVASALGMSVSSVKRWVDSGRIRATRTVGKHRLIPASEAMRFARELGLPRVGVESALDAQTPRGPAIDEAHRRTLVDHLENGRRSAAETLIRSLAMSGCAAAAIGDDLVRPVMERVGHGWQVGKIDVYLEHEASRIVAGALSDLIARHAEPNDSAPCAVGAAAEGDPYVLPGLLGELVLREIGWNVRNLGVHLPLRSLAAAVTRYRPTLVFLSVSFLGDPERFLREYAEFHEIAARHKTAVIVGGQALVSDLRARMSFAAFGERMSHLAEFGRVLLPGAPEAARPGTSDSRGGGPASVDPDPFSTGAEGDA